VGPLASADWSLRNSLLVMAAIRSEIYVWDLSRPASAAIVRKAVHEDGVRHAKFAIGGGSSTLVASSGQPNYGVKVISETKSHIFLQLYFSNYSVEKMGV